MSYVIVFANQKGGVGKTTAATSTADALMQLGKRVLLLDLDPQCNATDTYRAETIDVATAYDVFKGYPVADSIQHTEAGDIIACDPLLMSADAELYGSLESVTILKEALAAIMDDYDYIIIDTRPSLGALLNNALACADSVIIPVTASRYAIQGIGQLNSTIDLIREKVNPKIEIMGILHVKRDKRLKATKDAEQAFYEIAEEINTSVFDTMIPTCSDAVSAQNVSALLSKYCKRPNRAKTAYMELAREIDAKVKVRAYVAE